MNRKMKITGIVAGALALAGVAGGAYAAIPSTSGSVYHACVNNTGPLRTIYMLDKDAGESCFGGYTEKTWNQAGPTGPAGPAGATGPAGAAGSLSTTQVTASDNAPTVVGTEGPNNIYSYDPIAHCPTGSVATGGGVKAASLTATTTVGISGPTADGTGWQGHLRVSGNSTANFGVTVICAVGTTTP